MKPVTKRVAGHHIPCLSRSDVASANLTSGGRADRHVEGKVYLNERVDSVVRTEDGWAEMRT